LQNGVQAITARYGDTCALVNGGVQCWGSNATTPSFVPVQVSGLQGGVQAIAGSTGFTCALLNGGVQCWGSNNFGDLGNGSTTGSSVPVQVSGWSL
jgi:hypothetical protein